MKSAAHTRTQFGVLSGLVLIWSCHSVVSTCLVSSCLVAVLYPHSTSLVWSKKKASKEQSPNFLNIPDLPSSVRKVREKVMSNSPICFLPSSASQ